ncbi:MAG: hypothetical protein JW894_13925 [Bacteroidales bacterium]|nr:hypothetical protein [Bacteroidales bacterium]
MSKTQLSSSEIQDLINKYNSELKKLQYQVDEVIYTIRELERMLVSVEGREKEALSKLHSKKEKPVKLKSAKKRGRPRKVISVTDTSASTKTTKKGYKLSKWDEMVIEGIKTSGKVLLTSELVDFAIKKSKKQGSAVNEEEAKNRVVRSLQKLVNRRHDLAKVKYRGKGFAYALPEWVNARGTLDKQFSRKK